MTYGEGEGLGLADFLDVGWSELLEGLLWLVSLLGAGEELGLFDPCG